MFGVLNQYRMKLTPEKCSLFIKRGKFLGYIVSSIGIEPNPKKESLILDMLSPAKYF